MIKAFGLTGYKAYRHSNHSNSVKVSDVQMVLLMEYTVEVTGAFVQIAAINKTRTGAGVINGAINILPSPECSLFLLPLCFSTLLDWF